MQATIHNYTRAIPHQYFVRTCIHSYMHGQLQLIRSDRELFARQRDTNEDILKAALQQLIRNCPGASMGD